MVWVVLDVCDLSALVHQLYQVMGTDPAGGRKIDVNAHKLPLMHQVTP